MIQIFLDGKEVIPAAGKNIKMTKENPSLTEKGTYSLDIELPLNILVNRQVFGPIGRSETRKQNTHYSCTIRNRATIIFTGEARITKVSDLAVSVQATSDRNVGLSADIAKKYIDEVFIGEIYYEAIYGTETASGTEFRFYHRLWIPYNNYNGKTHGAPLVKGEIIPPPPDNKFLYMAFNDSSAHMKVDDIYYWKATGMTQNGEYFASADGNFVFVPAYNETKNEMKNDFFWWQVEKGKNNFEFYQVPEVAQPRLFYIIEKLFYQLGYDVDFSEYSAPIYKSIYIANARSTRYPNYMLPHWTVAELLEQLKLFLRCDIIVDEYKETITFHRRSEDEEKVSEVEITENFDAEVSDEEAKELDSKFTIASNIGYDLSDSHDYDHADRNLLMMYKKKDLGVVHTSEWENWTEEEKAKYLYENAHGVRACYNKDTKRIVYIDQFRDVVVNETEELQKLKISPVGLQYFDFEVKNVFIERRGPAGQYSPVQENTIEAVMLTMTDERDSGTETSEDLWADINNDAPEKSEPEDRLQVFFFTGLRAAGPIQYGWRVVNIVLDGNGAVYWEPEGEQYRMIEVPCGWTDYTYKNMKYNSTPYSLCLAEIGDSSLKRVATYGENTQKTLDFRTQHTFQFIADTPPDVENVFLIRGKKYLCEKIEYDIKEDGIDPLMTGYFYEVIE